MNVDANKEHKTEDPVKGLNQRNALRASGITDDAASSDMDDAVGTMSITNFFMAALFFTIVIVFAAYIPRKSQAVEVNKAETPRAETEEVTVSYQSDYVSFGIVE